jgi:hypothetical protein
MKADEGPERLDDPEADRPQVAWSQLAQDMAVTLWPSFLAASVATMFFFAFFDPSLFGEGAVPPHWLNHRMAGYAVGFFFFWAICTLSSALTLYLVRTASQPGTQDRR